ncbi:hypothetical protein VTO73DRAFT_7079 [Trametes versicolor]
MLSPLAAVLSCLPLALPAAVGILYMYNTLHNTYSRDLASFYWSSARYPVDVVDVQSPVHIYQNLTSSCYDLESAVVSEFWASGSAAPGTLYRRMRVSQISFSNGHV